MLTTVDNPYNPNTDYVQWLDWDQSNQYFTQEYLARLANVTDDMTDEEIDEITDAAIQEILDNDDLNIYKIID
ncbi:MAG: hypothetical protein RR643_04835 [Anaerorhabdus sp.]|uniref:hypothetical protein n=1 Tax=Anaerorhabdus sp. TaxID=1872524 RepID=UPI002FCAF8C4